MIYNCELCNKGVYKTEVSNLKAKVIIRSMEYQGHRWCHDCVDDICKNKYKMEVFHETI